MSKNSMNNTKVLFYGAFLSPVMCGTTVYTVKLLFAMHDVLPKQYIIDVCVSDKKIDNLTYLKGALI